VDRIGHRRFDERINRGVADCGEHGSLRRGIRSDVAGRESLPTLFD
jgi:hypothetical protein